MSETRNVTLPNGAVIKNVPISASKEEIKSKAIQRGLATEQDFSGFTAGDAFVFGLQEGGNRLVEGIGQLGMGVGENLGLVSPEEREAFNENVRQQRAEYLDNPMADSSWAKVGQFIGEVGPTMIVPGGAVGGLARKIGTSALAGAGTAGVMPTESGTLLDSERGANILSGAALGGGTSAVLQGVPATVQAGRNLLGGAKRQVKRAVGKEDLDPKVTAVADQYGIKLTPAEASGLQEVSKFEESLSTSSVEASRELGKFIRGRMGKIDAMTNDLMESIVKNEPAVAVKLKEGYGKLSRIKLKPETRNELFNLKVVNPQTGAEINLGKTVGKPFYDRMLKDSAWSGEFNSYPKNSLMQYDVFKRYLQEQESKLFDKGQKKLSDNVKNFRQSMVAGMDELSPSYAPTRQLAQLSIARKFLQKERDSLKTTQKAINKAGDTVDIIDPVAFYRKTFKSEKDFNELSKKLSSSPESVKKLEQLRTILGAIEDSPINKQMTGALDQSPQPAGGGVGGVGTAATLSFLDFYMKKRSSDMINYITNNNWSADLLESVDPSALRKGSVAAYNQLSKLLSRVGATSQVTEMGETQQGDTFQIDPRTGEGVMTISK